jgi:general secretion pathway protein D
VSQVKAEINLGGINEPEISQNKVSADVRLREGEVSLIGGIIQQTDSKSVTGIPGLTNLPILGRLFSGENLEKDRTELVIALIPHIVRAPAISESDMKGVASGNATQIKVSYVPANSAPGNQPSGVLSAPPATAPLEAGPVTNPTQFVFTPSHVDAQLGSQVTVTLYGDNISNLTSIAAHLQFDPHLLRVNNVAASDLLKQGGAQIRSTENILNDSGQADFAFSRSSGAETVSGSGGLVSVVFQAVGRGDATVNASLLSVGASPPPLNITIR